MRRRHGALRHRPGRRMRDAGQIRLLGLAMVAAGLVLLFLCIPGWAWAALIGAGLIVAGFWLLTPGRL